MDLSNYFDMAINGVPLLAVVIGVVEYVKAFGVSGKVLTAVSGAVGLLLGGLYNYAVYPPEAGGDFTYWFGLVIYGIMIGLVASGVYSAAKNVIGSGLAAFSRK